MTMDGKAKQPRLLAEIEADMQRAARRGDNMVILLAVIAAATLAWMTVPHRRVPLMEVLRKDAINHGLCQAYLALAPDKTYADFSVCLPPMHQDAADGR